MRTLRLCSTLTLGVAAVLLALAGVAEAQSSGGSGGNSGGSSGSTGSSGNGGENSAGALVLYGTPGNCPPTVACGGETRRPPRTHRSTAISTPESCESWETAFTRSGRRIRVCRDD